MILQTSTLSNWLKGCISFLLLIALAFVVWPNTARSQAVRSEKDVAAVVVLDKISVQNGAVSGTVHNKSSHIIRDLQLFIRYSWLWDNEFKPGKDDPGTSTFYKLPQEIPPQGTISFTFTPATPLPKVSGGRFQTSVSIAGFTEVIPYGK